MIIWYCDFVNWFVGIIIMCIVDGYGCCVNGWCVVWGNCERFGRSCIISGVGYD